MSNAATDPHSARRFRFTARHFDAPSGEARLEYAIDQGPALVERIRFPYAPWPQEPGRQAAFFNALEVLHLLAGVSYYKAGLPAKIVFETTAPDPHLAGFVADTWRLGLAEFAHRNDLDLEGRIHLPAAARPASIASTVELPERALVAMGGGKDSLVALDLLRTAGVEVQPFTVGGSELIRETVHAAGLPLLEIGRELAPELRAMNAAGAWNGHVPITAINSAIGLCAALLYGYRWVVFANERSADEATLYDARGRPVNHQYSKSLAFEKALRAVVSRNITPGVAYFSLLRPLGELAVCRKFAALTDFHGVFSSCNRNFHRDGPRISTRWCANCPKCRFTTLALAPFMEPGALSAILGANLLDDAGQVDGFRALCGLGADKPFECVGTLAEARAAMAELSQRAGWSACAVVKALAGEVADWRGRFAAQLEPSDAHCIPPELAGRVAF